MVTLLHFVTRFLVGIGMLSEDNVFSYQIESNCSGRDANSKRVNRSTENANLTTSLKNEEVFG